MQIAQFDIKIYENLAGLDETIRSFVFIHRNAKKIQGMNDKGSREAEIKKLGVDSDFDKTLGEFITAIDKAFEKSTEAEQKAALEELKKTDGGYGNSFLKKSSFDILKDTGYDPKKDSSTVFAPLLSQGGPLGGTAGVSSVKDSIDESHHSLNYSFQFINLEKKDGISGEELNNLLLVIPEGAESGIALRVEGKDSKDGKSVDRLLVYEIVRSNGNFSIRKEPDGSFAKPKAHQGNLIIQGQNRDGQGAGINIIYRQIDDQRARVDIVTNDKNGLLAYASGNGFNPNFEKQNGLNLTVENRATGYPAIQLSQEGKLEKNPELPNLRRPGGGYYSENQPAAPTPGGQEAPLQTKSADVQVLDLFKGAEGIKKLKDPGNIDSLVETLDRVKNYVHSASGPFPNGKTREEVREGLEKAKTLAKEIQKSYADSKTPDAAKINELDAQLVMARAVAEQAQRDLIRKTSGNKDDKEFAEIIAMLMAGQIPLSVALIYLMKFLKKQKVHRLGDLMTKLNEINQAQNNMRPEDAGPGGAALNAMQSEASIVQAQISSTMGEMTQVDERTFSMLASLDQTMKFGIQRMG